MIPILDTYQPTTSGHFVSEKHLRISEILADFDPDLVLAWIPPEKREPGDKPFAVVHCPVGRESYVVLYADECDERILERITMHDLTKREVMKEMNKHNELVRQEMKRKQKEQTEAAHDIVEHVFKSPGTTYTADGVKYHSHEPAVRFAPSKEFPNASV